MNLYIDCEWNEYQGELISMALVSSFGHEWYEVLGCVYPKPWVEQNVMGKLGKSAITIDKMRDSLHDFLFSLGLKELNIIADWPEDIAKFCELLIAGPGLRINTPELRFQIVRIDAVSKNPHNALDDAKALMNALENNG